MKNIHKKLYLAAFFGLAMVSSPQIVDAMEQKGGINLQHEELLHQWGEENESYAKENGLEDIFQKIIVFARNNPRLAETLFNNQITLEEVINGPGIIHSKTEEENKDEAMQLINLINEHNFPFHKRLNQGERADAQKMQDRREFAEQWRHDNHAYARNNAIFPSLSKIKEFIEKDQKFFHFMHDGQYTLKQLVERPGDILDHAEDMNWREAENLLNTIIKDQDHINDIRFHNKTFFGEERK